MDPVTVGLFLAATLYQSGKNKSAAKVEQANIKLETEQARLQAAEQAYERTRAYKKDISMNVALSGMGFGGVHGFRGISSEAAADYFSDIQALGRQDTFAQLTGNANKSLSRSKRQAGDVNTIVNAATLASQLGLFKGGK